MKVQSRASGRFRLFAWLVALAAGGVHAVGCGADQDDRFVLLRRAPARAPGQPTPLVYPADDDPRAARVRRLMSDGFTGELLRTFAMTRRLVEDSAPPGSVTQVRATAPAFLALGISDLYQQRPYRDRVIGTGWLRQTIAADVPIIWIDDEPSHGALAQTLAPRSTADRPFDPALEDAVVLEQIVTGLGQAIVDIIAPPEPGFSAVEAANDETGWSLPLRDGYVTFLNVVAAEWRSSAGDGGSIDARAYLRRGQAFAAVRANRGLTDFQDQRRNQGCPPQPSASSSELDQRAADQRTAAVTLVRDPTVIAATLYRIAASAAGHRLAHDEVYRPFIQAAPPQGISPGRLLGAFRNFQAKLLAAWNAAAQAGRAPINLIDLIEVYAAAYPDERAEVTRIFLITTDGLTARAGGVDPRQPPDRVASNLAALTADVLFGRRDLRTALRAPRSATPEAPAAN